MHLLQLPFLTDQKLETAAAFQPEIPTFMTCFLFVCAKCSWNVIDIMVSLVFGSSDQLMLSLVIP